MTAIRNWSVAIFAFALVMNARAEKREVSISAADGGALQGTLYTADEPAPGLLLLHECGGSRREYEHLAGMLNTAGYTVLTFDLRGVSGKSARKSPSVL